MRELSRRSQDLMSAGPSELLWRIGSGVVLVRPFVIPGWTDWEMCKGGLVCGI